MPRRSPEPCTQACQLLPSSLLGCPLVVFPGVPQLACTPKPQCVITVQPTKQPRPTQFQGRTQSITPPPPRLEPFVSCRRAKSASPFCVRRRTGGGGERSWLGAKEATCAGCLMTVSTAIQLSPWLHHPSTRFWAANFIGGGAQEGALKPCAYSNKGWARETCPPAYTKPTHILALY